MATSAATVQRRVAQLCRDGAASSDSRELRAAVLAELRQTIAFDAYAWLLTDPETKVGTAPLAEVPDLAALPRLIRLKYTTTLNRWTALPRGRCATLAAATGGDLSSTPLWRNLLAGYGVTDVASVVFADQFGCWGFLDLWRAASRGPYAAADAEFLAGLAAPLTAGLRRCQARTFTSPAVAHRGDTGPVALTLDDDLRIRFRTAASQAWLDVLLPPQPDERAVPASVYNVAAQLLAVEAGLDDHPASARTHLAGGFWLTLRAARLTAEAPGPPGGAGLIVVTIEEASAAERLEVFGRACGLTARERELLGVLAAGGDTRAIARQLRLSEHTVQDHLKSVFTKTGARDRVTVLSRALGPRGRPGG